MKVSIAEGRDHHGAFIRGIGLRCYYDPNGYSYPRPITNDAFDSSEGKCDGFEEKSDGSVTGETLALVGFDGFDGFPESLEIPQEFDDFAEIENGQIVGELAEEVNPPQAENRENQAIPEFLAVPEKNPPNPSNPTSVRLSAVTNPSEEEPNPSQPEINQGNLLYRRTDGQIEIDKLAIADSTPINAIAPEDDLSGWLSPGELEGMARDLNGCDDSETLALLRELWSPQALNLACKMLTADKHQQIMQWVLESKRKG
jgi:hypothetical protein